MTKQTKSEAQKKKELEALESYINALSEGLSKGDAAIKAGISRQHANRLKRKYLPNGFDDKLLENGFNAGEWNHGWLKVEGASIHIKNEGDTVSWEDFRDEFIKSAKEHAPKYPKINRKKSNDPHLLIVDIADMHIGKYATISDTGDAYDMDIAEQRVKEGIEGIIDKSSGFNIEKVLMVLGNDALHIDTPERKTTSGTPQDTHGQWHEAFIRARQLYIYMMELLMPIAPVHCIFNPSNHDYMSGFMLADSLASWFREADSVTFDVDMRHRKYWSYGNSLIGTTHGDGAKEKDLAKLMPKEARELWSKTKYAYWYCHHYHHKIAKDDVGVTIEYLRSPSSADRWHDVNGYVNTPAVEGFIHSKENGQIARLTHYCSN